MEYRAAAVFMNLSGIYGKYRAAVFMNLDFGICGKPDCGIYESQALVFMVNTRLRYL